MAGKKYNVSGSFEQHGDIVDHLLANMRAQRDGDATGVMLAGDPGVGKTSFIRSFAKLMGMTLVEIEAPHISEEHVINVPFMVFKPNTNAPKHGNVEMDGETYEIVLAKSALIDALEDATVVPEDKLLQNIQKGTADLKAINEQLGGDDDTVAKEIIDAREKHGYKAILFIDEYYRQTSARIRNVLRGILNGKIGSDHIPEHVFVVYASNVQSSVSDDGIEDAPMNQVFRQYKMKTVSKKDWFAWLESKFENDEHVKLNQAVLDKFKKILEDSDMSHNDVAAEVRVSPRRWEQLLLYINSSLPAKSEKDAKSLMTSVKANFKNYLSGDHAKIANKVLDAVRELIKETSGINVSTEGHDSSEWELTLRHQIEQAMKLKSHRTYVPIVSGHPGIAKTAVMKVMAAELGLVYATIDCSTLNSEDILGFPVGSKKDGKMTTKFSAPKMWRELNDEIEKGEKSLEKYLASLSPEQRKQIEAERAKHKFKTLIFFDEFNRVKDVKVFNALRHVMLNRSFGGKYHLPSDSLVTAAINPADKNTLELTGHMRDVVDVIDATPSKRKMFSYLQGRIDKAEKPEIAESVKNVLEKFIDRFAVKSGHSVDSRAFFIDIGGDEVYISMRDYTAIFSNTMHILSIKMPRMVAKIKDLDDARERAKVAQELNSVVAKSFETSLNDIFMRHGVQADEFIHNLDEWFSREDIGLGEGVFYKKVKVSSLASILDKYYKNEKEHLADDIRFMNYVETNKDDIGRIKEDILTYLNDKVKDFPDDAHLTNKNLRELRAYDHKDGKRVPLVMNGKEETVIEGIEHILHEIVLAVKANDFSHQIKDEVFRLISAFFSSLPKIKDGDELNKRFKAMSKLQNLRKS